LQRDFENTWILAKDLGEIAQAASDPFVRATAALVAKSYLYPVDSQVLSAAGSLLDHACVDDLFRDPTRYTKLLDAAGTRRP